nr:hypothetical protein CFP56_24568 [Quercus suber]
MGRMVFSVISMTTSKGAKAKQTQSVEWPIQSRRDRFQRRTRERSQMLEDSIFPGHYRRFNVHDFARLHIDVSHFDISEEQHFTGSQSQCLTTGILSVLVNGLPESSIVRYFLNKQRQLQLSGTVRMCCAMQTRSGGGAMNASPSKCISHDLLGPKVLCLIVLFDTASTTWPSLEVQFLQFLREDLKLTHPGR